MMVSSYTLITFLVLVLAGGIASIPITYKENSTSCIGLQESQVYCIQLTTKITTNKSLHPGGMND